jgi:anti-sigma factor RsiW
MNCNQARDRFIEIAHTGGALNSATPELSAHLSVCTECATLLHALEKTMSAMDEWTAPEASPYFDTRLQARLAEIKREEALAPVSVLAWLRKPVFGLPVWRPMVAGAFAVALAVGASFYGGPNVNPNVATSTKPAVTEVSAAVNDLQKLEKNQDLYSDFELLDDLKTDTSQSTGASKGTKAEL